MSTTENVPLSPTPWAAMFDNILGHITGSVKLDQQYGPYNPREKGPYEPELPTEEQSAYAIHELARQVSNTSSIDSINSTSTLVNPFYSQATFGSSPKLNPSSSEFNPKAWVKSVLAIQSRDPERYPSRSAGVSFSNLHVHGFGSPTDYQKTVGNVPLDYLGNLLRTLGVGRKLKKIQILKDFEGLVKSGEMCLVLGRPGSGCSTLLKTISGETHGLHISPESNLQYQGIPAAIMHEDFRGEVIYNAETDVHFPHLTVGDTLLFASHARAPSNRLPSITRQVYANHMRDVVMAMFGLTHTLHTKVGNDFIRGVSGGERKRVSIAECVLSGAPIQCWDNSTRGLDSANALEFVKTLRLGAESSGCTPFVAIYQCSQNAYDVCPPVFPLHYYLTNECS